MAAQDDALKAQIEQDPRVVGLARSRQSGSQPGVVTVSELRAMGYPITDDSWKYFSSPLAKFGRPRVIDENDKWDKIITAAAIGVMTAGVGMELAAAPAAAPSAAAPSATATAPLSTAAAPVATQAGGVTGGIIPGATAAPGVSVTGGTLATTAPAAAPGIVATTPGIDPVTLALTGGSMIANYFGARQQANAAKEAAKTQAESADKALAFQQRQWEDTQRNQAPWLQAGTGAINTMASLTGVPMLAPGSTSLPSRQPLASAVPPPTGGGLHPPLAPTAPRSVGMSATPAAQAARPSSLVTLQAPDGSTQQVPEQFASAFEARGARRVA